MRPLMSAALLLAALAFGNAAWAQSPPAGPWRFSIEGGGAHQAESDLENTGGGFEVDRWFIGAGVAYAWNRRNSIGLSLGGGNSDYAFDSAGDFGGGDPWGEIENARVGITGRFGVGETGSAIIIPTVRFNGEAGAGSGDSRTYGLLAAFSWRISEALTIGPGVGMFSKLEDGTRIFPILVIDWDISDRWNLSTGRGLDASQGPGLVLGYRLNGAWSLALSGRYENLEFRLDEDGPAPGGTGRDQSFPLVASVILEPDPRVRLSVFAGAELNGSLRLKNALDQTVDESDYDPALLVGATFAFRF